jgi:uncharacterized protein YdaU (DUF1376 family)
MAKDPAFLFYPGDWHLGTMHMTITEKGAYIELLMLQFARGKFTEADAKHMLNGSFDVAWAKVKEKFKTDGLYYYNERLELEREKRKKFSESRKINGLAKKISKESDNASAKHMLKHMEDENINSIKGIKTVEIFEIGSEKVGEIGNEVWRDQSWKHAICIGLNIELDQLKKWMSLFNASIASDKILDFDKSRYKKMFRGWVQLQLSKGHNVESSTANKTNSAPPLKKL